MPDLDLNLVGKTKGPMVTEYSWVDAALYALAVGTGPNELSLIYEEHPGGMKVLPGFAVVPAYKAWPDLGDIQWPLLIHVGQIIHLHQPIPPKGRLIQTGCLANVYDKGKGALLEITVSAELDGGGPLFEARWKVFYLGAGGFGGDKGPKPPIHQPPYAPPDFTTTHRIPETQAALYRLLGDFNALHIDPKASAMAGFDRPILHGLCTYGYASRAIINGILGGDPGRLKEFAVSFANPVYPGDNLCIKVWRDGRDCVVEANTANGIVLKNGRAELG